MQRRSTVVLAGLGVAVLVLVVLQFGLWLALVDPGEYERTQVTVEDETGERLGAVDVRIADTGDKRTVGLSRTDSLGENEGMLFVHEETGRHRYVMRGMDVPLDVVFVDADGTITQIHHADTPGAMTPESLLQRYAGEGRYVLEVNRGWTNETGVEAGDRVRIPAEAAGEDCGETTGVATTSIDEATPTPERLTLTACDRDGTTLETVRVAIADNGSERYTGLGETESLDENEGMLFVYGDEDRRAFVMRNMSFPLDMVFVGANGTVTEIHHASVPPPGTGEDELRSYYGTGQYVLEVDRGWTNETGLDEGDTIRVADEG